MSKYRLEIVADRRGIDEDHIIWKWFRLVPYGQTETTTIYAATSNEPLSDNLREILYGFVEDGDILSFDCQEIR